MPDRSSRAIREQIESLETDFVLDRHLAARFDVTTPFRASGANWFLVDRSRSLAADDPSGPRLVHLVDEYIVAWASEMHAWELQEKQRAAEAAAEEAKARAAAEAERRAEWERANEEAETRRRAEEAQRAELLRQRAERDRQRIEEAEARLTALDSPVLVSLDADREHRVVDAHMRDGDWFFLPARIAALDLDEVSLDRFAAFLGLSRLAASVEMDGRYAIFDPARWLTPLGDDALHGDPKPDAARRMTVGDRVAAVLADGQPRTVAEIAAAANVADQAARAALGRGSFIEDGGRPAKWTFQTTMR